MKTVTTLKMTIEPELPGEKYQLLGATGELGRGGMGQVSYGEIHFPLGQTRLCAIKAIRSDRVDSSMIALFAREALIGWDVTGHRNIVSTRTFGKWDDGRLFIVLDREGPALHAVADELYGEFRRVQCIAKDILSALLHLQGRGIVHGDISPANILLSEDGTAKLSDFGLARRADDRSPPYLHPASLSRGLVGVPGYAAPEVLRGARPSFASDAYSLGVVLYELATDTLPYGSGSRRKVVSRLTRKPAPLPDNTPSELARVIEGLIEPDPARRMAVDDAMAILRESDDPARALDDMEAIASEWIAERNARRGHGTNRVQQEQRLLSEAAEHMMRCAQHRVEPEPEPTRKPLSRWRQLAAGLLLLMAIPLVYHWIQGARSERAAATSTQAEELEPAPGEQTATDTRPVANGAPETATDDKATASEDNAEGDADEDQKPAVRRSEVAAMRHRPADVATKSGDRRNRSKHPASSAREKADLRVRAIALQGLPLGLYALLRHEKYEHSYVARQVNESHLQV